MEARHRDYQERHGIRDKKMEIEETERKDGEAQKEGEKGQVERDSTSSVMRVSTAHLLRQAAAFVQLGQSQLRHAHKSESDGCVGMIT